MSRISLGKSIPSRGSIVNLKKAVWHDLVRNRLRAKLARVLQQGSQHVLLRDFGNVASGLADLTPKAVLVLCEGLDQAKAMRKLLGWPLVSDLDDDSAEAEAAANTGGGIITTVCGLHKICNNGIDVVVRMDLGKGLPPLPPGWLAAPGPSPRPLLVADVHDHGHHDTERWALLRRKAYLSSGWTTAGLDPDMAALERFKTLILEREERP